MRNFLNVIYKSFGAVLISMLLFVSAHSEEWHIPLETKEGGYVGAEFGFAPSWDIGVIGGYQWYFYDKPYFHLGVRLAGHLNYSYSDNNHSILIGLAPQFIWDFLNIDSHTLGVHFAPLGFNVYGIFDGGTRISSGDSEVIYDASGSFGRVNYEFSVGLHYYIDIHHQLYLTFRYGSNNVNLYSATKWASNYINLGYAYKF